MARPAIILLGVVIAVLAFHGFQSSRDPGVFDHGVLGPGVMATPEADVEFVPVRSSPGSADPILDPIVPLETLQDALPFSPDETLLSEVRDHSIPREGVPEQKALVYLLHRMRAGEPLPVHSEAPEYESILSQIETLRGQRFRLHLTLIEEPWVRYLPENPSGVRQYWEAFAHDAEWRIHRLLFVEKDRFLPGGVDFSVNADFLRVHSYVDSEGRSAAVPQWVAYRLDALDVAPQGRPWVNLVWIGAAVLTGVVALALIASGRKKHFEERRRQARVATQPGEAAAPDLPQ
ncbi:MAG: hypothetical protein V3T77_03970 [Planctomycetota bacterium]